MTPNDDSDIDPTLLERYLAGEATPADVAQVDQWMAGAPERRAYVESVRAAGQQWGRMRPSFDTRSAWESVRARLGQRSATAVPARSSQVRGTRIWPRASSRHLAAIAAVVILAIGIATVVGTRERQGPDRATLREYATAAGERETVTLPDGTLFMLAPSTRLRLGAQYGFERRDVYLDGQAYFVVAHDARRPFVVHAANAVAEDIGTRFVVRSYAEESMVRVVVTDGIVALRDTTASGPHQSELRRGALGRVDRSGKTSVVADVDTASYLGWTEGRLVFDAMPLSDVARELSRWYGVDVVVRDSTLAAFPFTGAYRTGSVEQVVSFIAAAVGGRYERQGRTLTIVPR